MSREADLEAKGGFAATDIELGPLVSDIVSAYVGHHTIEAANVPELIQSVRTTLLSLGQAPISPEVMRRPAVPIKKSVFPNYIICLEDGKKLKMMKRHLQAAYGMTPDEYRAKWGLPDTYPMVAPVYVERRSNLAKASGFGQKRQPAGDTGPVIQIIPEGQRGRKRPRKTGES